MEDDLSITDDCRLLRRIPAQPNVFIHWDANRRVWGISSQAFRNHKTQNAISVNLESVLFDLGLAPEAAILDPDKYALAAVTVGRARGLMQTVQRRPEPGDESHAHMSGDKPKSVQQALASSAEWIVAPRMLPP